MTREEEINYASKDYVNYILDKQEYHNEDYTEYDIRQAFEKGAKWADITMIEKACKWLLKGGYFVNNTETINDFKQAMEKQDMTREEI